MNIYDFDKTIYDGDSTIDFFKYSLKKHKRIILLMPKIILSFILYMLKIKEKEHFKSMFLSFIKYSKNIEKDIEDFWKINNHKIKDFYLKNKKETDIIISASPELFLKPISKKLNFKLIGTIIDKQTGKIIEKNCYGEEKVKRLEKIGITKCEKFYSDSLSDTPLKNISKSSFIIKDNTLIEWENYKEKYLKKIIKQFLNPDFFTFLAIGVINAINGIWMAYVYSLIIKDEVIAYIVGFITSLTVSYILNSLLNFKQKLTLKKYIKFTINNIPNFIIQILTVYILIKELEILKLFSYSISSIIAVPLTFMLIKTKVFYTNE